jgi:hypothetical protein
VGLILWNLLNALVLLFAVYYLPGISDYQKGLILILSLVELMTSLQNDQSNALIAGLFILAFGLLEKDKCIWAVFCIVFSSYIKLFGLMGFALILFYPGKLKSVLYSIFLLILFSILPLLFVSLKQYMFLISEWWGVITLDYSGSYGYSIMGWLNSWFGIELNKLIVIGAGLLLIFIPFLRIKKYRYYGFRLLTLVSLLIWVVIFNHKAESPTFIIAMVGISTWFVIGEKTTLNIILFVTAFIFTSLSPTDIFPMFIREGFLKPYIIKVVPCIIIWCKIVYDLIFSTDFRIYRHKKHSIPDNA